jgi:hypothetical protein
VVTAVISSTRAHQQVDLHVKRPNNEPVSVTNQGQTVDEGRTIWRYAFDTDVDGLYEIRFIGDRGARLLALRLLRVAREVQLVPSDAARTTISGSTCCCRPRPMRSGCWQRRRGDSTAVLPLAFRPTMPGWVIWKTGTYWPSIPTIGPRC